MNREKVTDQSWYTVSDEKLMLMSSQNPELQFERNANGTIDTMLPNRGISGNREAKAGAYLLVWVGSHDLGEIFGSSTCKGEIVYSTLNLNICQPFPS